MSVTVVDVLSLNSALESRLSDLGMSRRQLARETGLQPSTLTRLRRGKRPNVEAFAALVTWLGRPAEDFFSRREVEEP